MLRGYVQHAAVKTTGASVFTAATAPDGTPVVLKAAKGRPGHRLALEFDILEDLREVPGVVRPVALETDGAETVLVLERFDGIDLRERLAAGPLPLVEALDIAVRLTTILADVHRAGVVHRDIKPPNVMVADDGEVRLIDFELSTSPSRGQSEGFVGTLAYMAPEQTGRMDSDVDRRADLYALGVTLFELVTGRLPFERSRPLDYIQAHLAAEPPRVDAIDPTAPAVVGDIIERLLQKDRAQRYQTAEGVLADLQAVREALAGGEAPARFPLGRHDGRRPLPSPGMVGREAIVERFTAHALAGAGWALLIGPAGIGKSSVFGAVRQAVLDHGGRVLLGRFEQYGAGRPFAGFALALDHLADQLLGAPAEALAGWRAALQRLGGLAPVITQLAPRFGTLLAAASGGTAPTDATRLDTTLPDAAPDAVRNRVQLAVERLVHIAAEVEPGPLVLVLDDLQRADAASLWLLERLVEAELPLFVLSAARPADPAPWGPLVQSRAAAGRRPPVEQLEPLTDADIVELVAAMTGRRLTEAQPLARLTAARSENNPLLARQFLTYLADTAQLLPHPDGGFTWDLDAVMGAGLPETLAETLAARLHRLDPEARTVLTTAACVGSTFDPQLVFEMCDLPRRVFDVVLDTLRRQGLVGADARRWGFAHDRIHEAAHGLLDESARMALHRRIGEHLFERFGADTLAAEIFVLVDHLNQAGPVERPEGLARLNLLAGQRALGRGAWQAAAGYLERGLALLDGLPAGAGDRADAEPDAETQAATNSAAEALRQLRYELTLEEAQAAFLIGRHAHADAQFKALLDETRDPAARLRVVFRRVVLLTARDRMAEAIDVGLAALAEHGVKLPRTPSRLQRALALHRARRATTEEIARGWLDLPPVRDEVSAILLRLMPALGGASYAVDKGLFVLLLSRTVTEMTRRGRSAWAGIGLSTFAIILLGTGRMQQGLTLLDVARELGRTLPPGPSTRMAYVVWLFGRPWTRPFAECCAPMRAAADQALEAGDIEYGVLLLTGMHVLQFFAAEDLGRLADDLASSRRRLGPYSTGARLMVQAQMQSCVAQLDGSEPLDAEELARGAMPGDRPNIIERRLLFVVPMLCVFGEFELAIEAAERLPGPEKQRYFGLAFGPVFHAYHALARLAAGRSDARRFARRQRTRLERLARRNPSAFDGPRRALDAEMDRAAGRTTKALAGYARAVEAAHQSGDRLLLGLLEERWAGLYAELGLSAEAALHTDEAREVYGAWGALGKVQRMGPSNPQPLVEAPTVEMLPALSSLGPRASLRSTSSLGDVGERLDMETVWTVARALAGDLRLDTVIAVLLEAAVHNAGATAGLLALNDEAGLRAVGRWTTEAAFTPLAATLDAVEGVPDQLIRYVSRTGESVVLDRADRARVEDAFLAAHPSLSVLCVPLSTPDGPVGVLYLENDRTGGAFTAARTRLLQLIGMQAAVSLANARLHEATEQLAQTLEQRVEARTAELAVARDQALEATRAKSAFLAAMSHEIRTPMNGLLGTAQLLNGTALDERQRAYVDIIAGSADSLLRVLNDILDFSKIEAGRFEISPRPFDLPGAVDTASATVGHLALRKGLTVAVHVDPELPSWVRGDESRLRQILLNLLGNAIKFTPAGGIELAVDARADGRVRFEVRDTGIGISSAQLERLFEPFAQADDSISRRFGGTGLGLAISRRLVELMGGEIGVSSQPGRGSQFWFELPLPPAAPPRPAARPAPSPLPDDRPERRLLVVEDNPVNQKITRWMLERQGYVCDVADNGRLALERESAGDYDLILMDCQMPEMDGLEATRRLRARGCRLPIIALTAGAMEDERAACLAAGMDDFVAKPIKLPTLLATVERHMGSESGRFAVIDAADDEPPPVEPTPEG